MRGADPTLEVDRDIAAGAAAPAEDMPGPGPAGMLPDLAAEGLGALDHRAHIDRAHGSISPIAAAMRLKTHRMTGTLIEFPSAA